MKNKTVYDELLSYKIPSGEVKVVADAFIKVQNAGAPIMLEDLIRMHRKKANLTVFADLIIKAKDKGIEIPTDDFYNAKLSRDDYTNLLEGWIHAKDNNLMASFSDLAKLAKTKINIVSINNSLIELRQEAKVDVSFAEFVSCKFCLFKTDKLVAAFKKLRKADETLDIKQVFIKQYEPEVMLNVLKMHGQIKNLDSSVSLQDLFDLKSKGLDIRKLINALGKAKERGHDIEWETAVRIEQTTKNIDKVVDRALAPEISIIKPVNTILKNGLELLLKIKIRRRADIPNYLPGMYGDMLRSKIKDLIKQEVAQYEHLQDVYANSAEIGAHVQRQMADVKTSYEIIDVIIEDIEIGRNIKAEEELRDIQIKRVLEEEKAALLEARIRSKEAKTKLEVIDPRHSSKESHQTEHNHRDEH